MSAVISQVLMRVEIGVSRPSFWRVGSHLHTLPLPSLSLVILLDKTYILSIFLHLLAHENFMPIIGGKNAGQPLGFEQQPPLF